MKDPLELLEGGHLGRSLPLCQLHAKSQPVAGRNQVWCPAAEKGEEEIEVSALLKVQHPLRHAFQWLGGADSSRGRHEGGFVFGEGADDGVELGA